MPDQKMQGTSIVRRTSCLVGGHIFSHTGPSREPPPDTRCSCGAYSWVEWKDQDVAPPQ